MQQMLKNPSLQLKYLPENMKIKNRLKYVNVAECDTRFYYTFSYFNGLEK